MTARSTAALGAGLVIAGACLIMFAFRGSPAGSGGTALPSDVTTTIPAAGTGQRGGQPAPLARSVPVGIRIPAIGVAAPVVGLGLNADGSVQVPPLADHNLAGWYEYGPTPGQRGASVILGHVDSSTGPSVFFRLKDLRKGQLIVVSLADGRQAAFTVDGVQAAPKDHFPTNAVYGQVLYQGLRLITCGGPFNPSTGHYLDNVIVYAQRRGA